MFSGPQSRIPQLSENLRVEMNRGSEVGVRYAHLKP